MHFFFLKKIKVHFSYFTYIFAKTEFILKNVMIKTISEKFSTNPESFNGFERGRRNDPVISGGMTLHLYKSIS